ncbi:MAG TPA: methyltransferase domain-containing protein [Gemmatimonadaceae bacterium]|nr:methyltransferase domain-containing protein [Gemmatimonadaceae bacterium]
MRRAAVLGAILLTSGLSSACRPPADARGVRGDTLLIAAGDTGKVLAPPGAAASRFPAPSRPVADIVAPRWSNEDDRDDIGEAERVMRLLGALDGKHVADIGAGDGYYVARLTERVGATGRVYGEDITPRYLELLAARARQSGWNNVEIVRGEPHDPRLPAGTLDAAIMIHMYHEISQPFGLLWNLATALKPGGRLVIMDLDRPTWGHGTPLRLLRCELAAVGYRESRVDRAVPGEYIALFIAPAPEERPSPEAITEALSQSPCTAPGGGR